MIIQGRDVDDLEFIKILCVDDNGDYSESVSSLAHYMRDRECLIQITELFPKLGPHLPFELILQLCRLLDFDLEEGDEVFGVSGFTAWCRERREC